MSKLSQMYSFWKNSITQSKVRFNTNLSSIFQALSGFYENVMPDFAIEWDSFFSNPTFRHQLSQKIESFFQKREINFVAIDGTCTKWESSNYLIFFAGAYGARGKIILAPYSEKIKYEKWDFSRDVTMMAQIPIMPYEIEFIASEEEKKLLGISSDKDYQEILNLHVSLMRLAEIYLAYHMASSSTIDMPQIILLDLMPSSLLRIPYVNYKSLGLLGHRFRNDTIKISNVVVSLSHPFNYQLLVPSKKKYRDYSYFLAKVTQSMSQDRTKTAFTYDELCRLTGKNIEDLKRIVQFLEKNQILKIKEDGIQMDTSPDLCWQYTVEFFEYFCSQLFIKKDPKSLELDFYKDSGTPYQNISHQNFKRVISHDDINFLISVGIRALIEKCWDNNILLVGIAKDSQSRYFSRNYLKLLIASNLLSAEMKEKMEKYPIPILCSDRLLFENYAYFNHNLNSPWSSVEFDSALSTLFVNEKGEITGVKGHIVADDRIFAKSIAQFFISRKKKIPSMGHAIFIERLLHPSLDKNFLENTLIDSPKLGSICPFIHLDKTFTSWGQAMNMYFLSVLTKNHFPEVIGYPEPLHKADRSARTLLRFAKGIIKSSDIEEKRFPLAKPLRKLRDNTDFEDEN
ncbi:hypothetical protein [Caldicellulosiruptor sp. F32]|uniref:hypothetical protein n=1 Tax=Caldicellulosiruptor sp. F32 TaxID=1214564 RepID=UPI00039ABF47|nr:hypothetical protein [Caldicellulosiruptor sp. F32]